MKFRRKPILVEAQRWDPTSESSLVLSRQYGWQLISNGRLEIREKDVVIYVNPGDYIVCNELGEYSAHSAEVFNESYEKVDV